VPLTAKRDNKPKIPSRNYTASRNKIVGLNTEEYPPNYLKTTTSYMLSSRVKKKVAVSENIYREPSLKLLKDIKEEG
jgi:hypothetical protein